MKSKLTQASLAIHSAAGRPQIRALKTSGYWLDEWFPQIVIRVMSPAGRRAFFASALTARLWSSRVSAENLSAGTPSALW